MGWSSKYICLGLPSICICVEAKALSGRSTTGLMGESQNPLAGLRGWKLYKDPFISLGGKYQSHHLGVIGMTGPPQKNILKHLLQLRRYDRYGCNLKGIPCRLHTETWEGGKRNLDVYFLVVKYANETWFEACHPKKNKWEGRKETSGKEFVCVWNLVFLKKNRTLPWELVTAFHG